MTLRSGIYIVPTHRWYIERTVWLIAGLILLVFTTLATGKAYAADGQSDGTRNEGFCHDDRLLAYGTCRLCVVRVRMGTEPTPEIEELRRSACTTPPYVRIDSNTSARRRQTPRWLTSRSP
jgi:hypothetical protein